MRAFLVCVFVLFSYLDLSFCYKNTYKTAIVNYQQDGTQGQFNTISASLKQMGVDLIMLMPKQSEFSLTNNEHCAINNFDELVDSTSKLATGANSYVVMESVEKSKCYDSMELFKTNIMIDRNGRIVSMLKSPVNNMIECNTTLLDSSSISTDFGVKFDIITDGDILTREPKEFDNKNYIVVDTIKEELPFFTSNQLLSSLSKSIGINLLSKTGVYGSGKKNRMENGILIAEFDKEPIQENLQSSTIYQSVPRYLSHEDLTNYVTRPIDLQASDKGLTEKVCHNKFCCEFYVKTDSASKQHKESNYSLVVFDGVRNIGGVHNIGVQNCAVIACKGLYKRSCIIESSHNRTTTTFENIRISANFSSSNSMQFPATLTTAILPMTSQSFNFDSSVYSTHKRVSIEKGVTEDLLVFGIFGRDYSKDFFGAKKSDEFDLYDYVFNADVVEFFDYAWIRIKVLLVIVTLYVLEQM